jgi:hypothetical protein
VPNGIAILASKPGREIIGSLQSKVSYLLKVYETISSNFSNSPDTKIINVAISVVNRAPAQVERFASIHASYATAGLHGRLIDLRLAGQRQDEPPIEIRRSGPEPRGHTTGQLQRCSGNHTRK